MRLGVVLFNLGGPDSPEAVEPFLRNLFSDPAIIALPAIFRLPLARFIAARRAPTARAIYDRIGGRSPILGETQAQASALEQLLTQAGYTARVVIAMRCWQPFSKDAVAELAEWKPDRIVLLPLYPQFSTTTTASSLAEWDRVATAAGLRDADARICCYPAETGFVAAEVALLRAALASRRDGLRYRVLFSAHGLPERVVAAGDPYRWQVEQSAAAIVKALGAEMPDHVVCFQSRVGPLKWIGPATDSEIRRAGGEGLGLIVAPIAFVSEHSETLVELDLEYGALAAESGVPDYIRVRTAGTQPDFIAGLAGLVTSALSGARTCPGIDTRLCPEGFVRCRFGKGGA